MPNGQVTTSGQGSVVKGVSLALVGLALTLSAGTIVPLGEGAAALTGSSSTSGIGSFATVTITPRPGGLAFSPSITGQVIAGQSGLLYGSGRSLCQSAIGSMVGQSTIPLLGSSLTAQAGLVSPNAEGVVPLVGTSSTVSPGSLLAPGSLALTGVVSTTAAGTLALTLRPTDPVGQAVTSATGSVSIEANNVTVNISGVEADFAQGVVDSQPLLTGLSSASGLGSVVQSASVVLAGTLLAGAQGAVGLGQDAEDTSITSATGSYSLTATVPLTGTASTTATGSLGITGDVFQAVTGAASTSAAGTLAPVAEQPIFGSSFTAERGTFGAPGFGDVTGQLITMSQGSVFVTQDRDQALSGTSMSASVGSVGVGLRSILSGLLQSTSIGTMGRSGGNMQQALTGDSSTWNTGTLGVIGQDILPPGVSNEGCSIVSAVAAEQNESAAASGAEGCFIQSGTAREV